MANITEIGAEKIKIESYQCSIKKVTVTTDRENPKSQASETVTATVFDSQSSKEGKSIYIISSPEGKDVTIKTERKEGKCPRKNHKKYKMAWDDYKKDETQDTSSESSTASSSMPIRPYKLINSPQKKEDNIKNEDIVTIKCFEIGGALETLKYLTLPVPLDKTNATKFSNTSCKEGTIHYGIISYPDISFQLEFTIGTEEAKKRGNHTSHFERKTKSSKYVSDRFNAMIEEAPGVDLKFCPPSFDSLITYNGGKDELELNIDFDTNNEILHFRYKHDSNENEFGSELLQALPGAIQRIIELGKLLKKVCNVQFLKDLLDFDATNLAKNYKAYRFKLNPPSVSVSVEGQYLTSKDLFKIGKYYDICCTCEPLVSISLTIDLLFLIISAVTAGTGTGIYVMLKNLDVVIGELLGDSYKKKYEDTKPFDCDIYFNLIVTGAINGDVHWIVDTTEQNANSTKGSIEGVLKVDLEAGAKVSFEVFYIMVEGEVSASGSSGISLKFGLENRICQGEGLAVLFETTFLGLKVKYCVKGQVGLKKTKSYGGSLVDGETTLLDKRKINLLSGRMVFLEDKS